MSNLLEMMCFLADENAREVKVPYRRGRRRGRRGTDEAPSSSNLVTAAMLEDQEWNAFKASLDRRRRLLSGGSHVDLDSDIADSDIADMDEDDGGALLSLIAALEDARERRRALTMAEIVRVLQRERVLTLEFPAAARQQAQNMLGKLRGLNRVWCDPQGRWSLL